MHQSSLESHSSVFLFDLIDIVEALKENKSFTSNLFAFVFSFLDPNFAEGHKIGTLGPRELIFFEMTIIDRRFELDMF